MPCIAVLVLADRLSPIRPIVTGDDDDHHEPPVVDEHRLMDGDDEGAFKHSEMLVGTFGGVGGDGGGGGEGGVGPSDDRVKYAYSL